LGTRNKKTTYPWRQPNSENLTSQPPGASFLYTSSGPVPIRSAVRVQKAQSPPNFRFLLQKKKKNDSGPRPFRGWLFSQKRPSPKDWGTSTHTDNKNQVSVRRQHTPKTDTILLGHLTTHGTTSSQKWLLLLPSKATSNPPGSGPVHSSHRPSTAPPIANARWNSNRTRPPRSHLPAAIEKGGQGKRDTLLD